jgi:hypothetical protein
MAFSFFWDDPKADGSGKEWESSRLQKKAKDQVANFAILEKNHYFCSIEPKP